MVKILTCFIFVFFLAMFLLIGKANAGGQLVSLYADVNGWSGDAGFGRVIRVFLHPEYPCKGTEITFKFVDPKDGDLVNTGSGTSTFTISEDRGNNGCGTYAKLTSKNPGERPVTVIVKNDAYISASTSVIKVDFDGKYHADNYTNGYSYRSSTDDPYKFLNSKPTPLPQLEGEIIVKVLREFYDGSNSRQVTIKWSAVNTDEGSVFYDVYMAKSNDKNWKRVLSDEGGPSATLTLKLNQDYFIKVKGCIRKVGNCVESNELYIDKIKRVSLKKEPQSTKSSYLEQTTQKADQNTDDVKKQNIKQDDKQIEELNRKVNDLQNKLEESKKAQSALEERIDSLMSFIKKLFPFFR